MCSSLIMDSLWVFSLVHRNGARLQNQKLLRWERMAALLFVPLMVLLLPSLERTWRILVVWIMLVGSATCRAPGHLKIDSSWPTFKPTKLFWKHMGKHAVHFQTLVSSLIISNWYMEVKKNELSNFWKCVLFLWQKWETGKRRSEEE